MYVTGFALITAVLTQVVVQFVPVDLAKVFVAAGATGALLPPESASITGDAG